MKIPRSPWNGFPDVLIHNTVEVVKGHNCYARAKAGDDAAAAELVSDTISFRQVEMLRSFLAGRKPFLVSVHAYESGGVNAIPEVFADSLSQMLDLPSDEAIVQTNIVSHTGADGYARLARQALFDGPVKVEGEYVIVDDFVGQGGTLANLRGYIRSKGANVIAAVTLTGKPYSATLALGQIQLSQLREKHGTNLEKWWQEQFGFSFDCLTQSEARYLTRSPNAETIRNRIAAAQQTGNRSFDQDG